MAAAQVMPPKEAPREYSDLAEPAPVYVPKTIPWDDDDADAAQSEPHAARAAAMLTSGQLFHDPVGTTTQTGGGILNEMSSIYGQTQQLGRSGGDDGLGDAEIPVRMPTKSYIQRDKPTRLADRINHYLRVDANMYTGPSGLLPYQRTNDSSVRSPRTCCIPASTKSGYSPRDMPTTASPRSSN